MKTRRDKEGDTSRALTEKVRRLSGRLSSLADRVSYLENILRQAGDIIVTTDLQGRITEFNEGAEDILGYRKEEVLGRPAENLYVDERQRQKIVKRLEREEVIRDEEIAVRTKSGKKVYLSLTLSKLRDDSGRVIGTVGVSKDISKRKKLERELRRLSITDSLSGLYNQSHFYERLEIEKERAIRLGHPLSMLLFDLDKFKELNDTLGHTEGDVVLRKIGGVIFETIRKEVDSGFRYGGDEFCILLPGADKKRARLFAERLRKSVEDLNLHSVTISIGITEFTPLNHSQQIVQEADSAMYCAKRCGGNGICVYGIDT
jgi:diguanylate cyclase (GGDEF)-like protein/PAS domain S-box-containing protein